MADLNISLDNYIRNVLALSQSDISSSANSREWFLKRIENVINFRNREPILYRDQPFLRFGSYFKKTKVAVVDEFDILVVIDSNSGVFKRGGVELGIGQGYADPNHKYDSNYLKEDQSGVSPTKMLNWLKGVVAEVVNAFNGESPIRNGQAVTAVIKAQNLSIDLVPAGIFHTPLGRTFYNIPKGDASNGWILTAPEEDMGELSRIAKDRANFRNVIRVLKRIRDQYNFVGVGSFALETATIRYAYEQNWKNTFKLDLIGVICRVARFFESGVILDQFDNKTNLIESASQLEWYAERLMKLAEDLLKCEDRPMQSQANEIARNLLEND